MREITRSCGRIGVLLQERFYLVELVVAQLQVRGAAERPDAVVETDPAALAALVYGGRPFAEALRSVDIEIEGDESAVERFLGLFPLPEPAAPAAGA